MPRVGPLHARLKRLSDDTARILRVFVDLGLMRRTRDRAAYLQVAQQGGDTAAAAGTVGM